MTVKELIAILQKYPQDIQVVCENALFQEKDMCMGEMCLPDATGWVSSQLKGDEQTQTYLILLGN